MVVSVQSQERGKRSADLETKPLSKAVAKHCFALGYVNMAEETAGRGMFGEFDSMQNRKDPDFRDGRQDCQLSISW